MTEITLLEQIVSELQKYQAIQKLAYRDLKNLGYSTVKEESIMINLNRSQYAVMGMCSDDKHPIKASFSVLWSKADNQYVVLQNPFRFYLSFRNITVTPKEAKQLVYKRKP